MITSPGESSVESAATVDSVGSPAGTITHTWRGGASAFTSASSDATPLAFAACALLTASALRSYATMSWPPRSRRVTMFKPILPRPTNPSCIDAPVVGDPERLALTEDVPQRDPFSVALHV